MAKLKSRFIILGLTALLMVASLAFPPVTTAAPVETDFAIYFDQLYNMPIVWFTGSIDFERGEFRGFGENDPDSLRPYSISITGTFDPARYDLTASGKGSYTLYIDSENKPVMAEYTFKLKGKFNEAFLVDRKTRPFPEDIWAGTATIAPETTIGGVKKGETLTSDFEISHAAGRGDITLPAGGVDAVRETSTDDTSQSQEVVTSLPLRWGPVIETLPLRLQDTFGELAIKYLESIKPNEAVKNSRLSNLLSPGSANNLIGSNNYACGSYQGDVLNLLEKIRNSPDQSENRLLEDFDFGPIQIAAGGHQAVVIFPKGTKWLDTGIVLDPWKEQRPEIYAIQGAGNQPPWCELFWLGLGCPPKGSVGNILVSIDANVGRYPTTPNPDGSWQYPGDVGRRNSIIAAERKKISVGSPVTVLVTASDGKKVGIDAQDRFVNDFGVEVEAHMFKAADGTFETTLNLPDGSYTLVATGAGKGDVHVFTADANGVREFSPVFVDRGDLLTLKWDEGAPILTDQQGREVPSKSVEDEMPFIFYIVVGAVIFTLSLIVIRILRRRGSSRSKEV